MAKAEAGKAKGSLATNNVEHQSPPSLYLGHEHLAKFGIKNMPAVGTKVKISGVAHVGATSENQDHGDGGGPRRSMTLHMHKMEVGTDQQSSDAKEQGQKDGMKAAIDKALTKDAGSESKNHKAPGKTPTPRGGGD